MHTIFALATARGKSGVAVIRISGPDAHEVGERLVGALPDAGRFVLRPVRNAQGEVLDQALVLRFDAPRSFTGENTVELQLHGSIAIIRAVEDAISQTGLAKMAEAGDFTRRALLNGNLDLAQVEGLSDLLSAETELQRQQAQLLFSGGLRAFSEACRRDLIRATALIEATIDFADEDVPIDVSPEVGTLIGQVQTSIEQELLGFRAAERLRQGFEVAVIGPPNAGKSTLINKIAGRDIAITSSIAGTTRDVLEVRIDLFGMPVTFLDTAGLRETDDAIESIGVERARMRAADADLRLLLTDGSLEVLDVDLRLAVDLTYFSKADVTGRGISALTGEGINQLLADVHAALSERVARASVASHDRHRRVLEQALERLVLARAAFDAGDVGAEILALHLRDAVTALDSLIGRVDVEAVLGAIFAQFCIGK